MPMHPTHSTRVGRLSACRLRTASWFHVTLKPPAALSSRSTWSGSWYATQITVSLPSKVACAISGISSAPDFSSSGGSWRKSRSESGGGPRSWPTRSDRYRCSPTFRSSITAGSKRLNTFGHSGKFDGSSGRCTFMSSCSARKSLNRLDTAHSCPWCSVTTRYAVYTLPRASRSSDVCSIVNDSIAAPGERVIGVAPPDIALPMDDDGPPRRSVSGERCISARCDQFVFAAVHFLSLVGEDFPMRF